MEARVARGREAQSVRRRGLAHATHTFTGVRRLVASRNIIRSFAIPEQSLTRGAARRGYFLAFTYRLKGSTRGVSNEGGSQVAAFPLA